MPSLPPTATSSDLALNIQEISKHYGSPGSSKHVHALKGVSMDVRRGEIFGLLGPNGAGKSTLVKSLMTIIRPTSCTGTMLGEPIGTKSALKHVGYLPEHHRFPEYLTARQVLDYFGGLSDIPAKVRKSESGRLLELVGLTKWTNHKVKGYSKGMRQRLGIANALIMSPDLVVLDEPTDGVDPIGRRDIREILVHLRSEGKTVFLNSHLLSELEMVCDRVAIMVQGKVHSVGTIDELTTDSRRYEIEMVATKAIDQGNISAQAQLIQSHIAGIAVHDPLTSPPRLPLVLSGKTLPQFGGLSMTAFLTAPANPGLPSSVVLSLGTDDAESVQPILDHLRGQGITIRALRPVRSSLEDLFMKAVQSNTNTNL